MMKLFDFQCTICKHTFEDLWDETTDPLPKCPICEQETEIILFCNHPTAPYSPRQSEITMKGRNMKNKILGKVPYRKSSESQTS